MVTLFICKVSCLAPFFRVIREFDLRSVTVLYLNPGFHFHFGSPCMSAKQDWNRSSSTISTTDTDDNNNHTDKNAFISELKDTSFYFHQFITKWWLYKSLVIWPWVNSMELLTLLLSPPFWKCNQILYNHCAKIAEIAGFDAVGCVSVNHQFLWISAVTAVYGCRSQVELWHFLFCLHAFRANSVVFPHNFPFLVEHPGCNHPLAASSRPLSSPHCPPESHEMSAAALQTLTHIEHMHWPLHIIIISSRLNSRSAVTLQDAGCHRN